MMGWLISHPNQKKQNKHRGLQTQLQNEANAGGRADVNGNPRKPPGQEHSGIVYRYPRSR